MKFPKITKENSKVHLIWGFICVFVGLFSMMAGQWQINKYEVLLSAAQMTMPSIVNQRALQAANRWEEICETRPAYLREYVKGRLIREFDRLNNKKGALNKLIPNN